MTDHPDLVDSGQSATAQVLADLELHGYHPGPHERDPRDCPEDELAARIATEILDLLVSALAETALDNDLNELLWSAVNMFHRAAARAKRKLDDNEQAQKRGQREQDGSEVKAVELETLIEIGQGLIERRDSLEVFRDSAAAHYLRLTGSPWSPRSGSRVNHRNLTSATIDSRDFLAARRRSDTTVMVPEGTKIAFAGGMDCQDHTRIWAMLDKVHAKHTDMVLLHGGSPKGAELIAAKWAEHRGVTQIAFKPDWSRHAKAAPFKRNDVLLDTLPVGLVVFPGTGITDNLADKARKLGIPLFDCRRGA
ncbi:DUF2493 domain-containing protein [Aestuariibius insulae]|uniref:DUF2493 domain-containing protein n=1 Tax=Aestuariibius insulae TaxID=2058287 RepID=UPI00345EBE64